VVSIVLSIDLRDAMGDRLFLSSGLRRDGVCLLIFTLVVCLTILGPIRYRSSSCLGVCVFLLIYQIITYFSLQRPRQCTIRTTGCRSVTEISRIVCMVDREEQGFEQANLQPYSRRKCLQNCGNACCEEGHRKFSHYYPWPRICQL
jgi:hypothetical protein